MDTLPRCQCVPEPHKQATFLINNRKVLGWHFGHDHPRPFFYPVLGPANKPLTRMGHPGAPNHDHHLSVWFAHEKVNGTNFWGDTPGARIRQDQWLCFEEHNDHAAMAVKLSWMSDEERLLTQELVAIVRPEIDKAFTLEVQSTFVTNENQIQLEPSNFGIFAVRLARELSAHFGGGKLTSSEGGEGETSLFGKYARWVDASGPVAKQDDAIVFNGITYFDHRDNPGYPAHWHVREDGWIGASLTRLNKLTVTSGTPLRARYLLHIHNGVYHHELAESVARNFAGFPLWKITPSKKKHQQFELQPDQKPS